MIVLLVEFNQLIVLQISDIFWFTSWIELILRLLEKIFIDSLQESFVGVAHGSLHFVVDYAFVGQARFDVIWIFKLKSVAFLAEVIVV